MQRIRTNQEVIVMKQRLAALATAGPLLVATALAIPAQAQQAGGILKYGFFDSPASMSMHEESTNAVNRPMSPVFNNLIMYKQDVKQNSPQSIIPDLATSWSWNEEGTELTMPLRQGVKWHDGKPFTAADVKCTWDLLQGKAKEKLRLNPRKSWYVNLKEVTTKGDHEVTFHLMRPQAGFLAMLATGWSPVYPCHVTPAQMRLNPIGTGPFKFVGFKANQSITLTRNPDYWKPGRPYLDGIEFTIIKDVSTRLLAFMAGKSDYYPNVTIPQLADVKSQAPNAICEVFSANVGRNLLLNPSAPPFDNPDLRRAVTLSLDRKAYIDIITAGQGDIGGVMQPPPSGLWGMPIERLQKLPGYDPDVQKNRAEARKIMEKLGYGPNNRLSVTVSTRNIPGYRDPAVLLIDQLKEIYIDAKLDAIDTTQWYPILMRKDYKIGVNVTETAVDDPDVAFYENYVCGAQRNYTGYCNPEVDKLIERQSAESDMEKRKQLVWQIEKKLAEDDARPILFYPRTSNCWQPHFKGVTVMVNSIYNGNRFEDVWLEQGVGSSAPAASTGGRR
jgi:peptide/nickel transport system substrate-binding protein